MLVDLLHENNYEFIKTHINEGIKQFKNSLLDLLPGKSPSYSNIRRVI